MASKSQNPTLSCLIVMKRGVEYNAPGGNYQDFLKWWGISRSFSYNN